MCAAVLMCVCALQRSFFFPFLIFLDQSIGELSYKEDSPHPWFLFRKLSVSGQYFLLHMLCQFYGAQSFPKSLAS